MRAAAAALGVAGLLLLPAAAGDGAPGLTASAVRVDGEATLHAPLAAAVLANASLARPDLLEVHVEAGTLTLDERRTDVWAAGVGVTPANQTSTPRPLQGARLHSFALGPQDRLLVIPGAPQPPALRATVDGAGLAAAPPGLQRHVPRASHARPPFVLDTAGTLDLHWEARDGAATVEAPFTLAVWDAGFAVTDGHGTAQVATGRRFEPILGLPNAHAEREAEAYVTVQAGRLVLPDGPWQAYAAEASLSVRSGSATLLGPGGRLDGLDVPAGSRSLELSAPVEAGVRAAGQDVSLALAAPPGALAIDGAAVRPAGQGAPWWPAALGLAVAVPAAAMAASSRRQRARLRRLDASMADRRFADAVADAEDVRRHRPRAQEALVAQALGLLHAGRFDEAAALLDRREWTAAAAPLRSFLRAAAAAGRGRRGEAVAFLADCLRRAPGMAWEAAAAPLLSGVVREAQARARGRDAEASPASP